MKCVICKHGETRPGSATVTLERKGTTVVVKSVPAQVCENCGEQYLDESIVRALLRNAEEAAGDGIQVEVRAYSSP